MKRLIAYFVLLAVLLSACKKKTTFEGERPDVRLAELLSDYEMLLTGADHGWLAYLFPEGGGGYTFKFTFKGDNRVVMYSDIQEDYANTAKESSYRLRATQVPSLYFDTYSYLHQLADPDPEKSGGVTGQGHLSDFEFSILSASADTVRLKGNLNGSELVLIRASETEGDDYISRAYAYNQQISKLNNFPYYYNKLSTGGNNYNFTINTDKNTVSFYSAKDGFTRFTTEYAVLDNGIQFRAPFIDNDVHIERLTNFTINQTTHTVTVQAGEQSASIINESSPIVTDPGAATRMYIANYQYTSDFGFTVGGVPDGYQLGSLTDFIGVLYYPRRYIDGYDSFYSYYEQGANYIQDILKTRIDEQGKMYFFAHIDYRDVDNVSIPPVDLPPSVRMFSEQLLQEAGYYVYQTGTNSYDLVSVADPRTWIRFY